MPFQFPDKIPSVARSWTPDEQRKCISAANTALEHGVDDAGAIRACITAAGKGEDSADPTLTQVHIPGALGGGRVEKVTKSEANYRQATGAQRCNGCRFFVKPSSCQVVAGGIDPQFTSDKYQALREQAAVEFLIPFAKALRDDILIFPVGKFYRDGQEREFTPEMGAQMVANYQDNILERKNGGWLPINGEHMREHGRLGDIVALYQDALGNVRGKPHDPAGKLAAFDYFSPEVRWQWTHPTTGKEHSNVLMGGGATNYPFFLGKMSLQGDVIPVAKSADLPLVWTGSEWEAFNMDKPLPASVLGRMLKTAMDALGKIGAMARGEQDDEPEDEMMPASEQTVFTHTVQFAASDEAKRILFGVVLEPDTLDAQGHIVGADDVESAAHDFIDKLRLDVHHDRLVQSEEARVVQTWIAQNDTFWNFSLSSGKVRTTHVKAGSWCIGVHVPDDELWSEVLSGEIGFFSPTGTAIAQQIT